MSISRGIAQSTYNRAKLADLQSTQIKIAEASAKIDAARLIMRLDMHRGDGRRKARLRSGYRRQDQDAARWGLFRQSVHGSRVAIVLGERRAGLFTSGALQRQFRDAHAINSQLRSISMRLAPNYGRVALACHPKT